MFALSDFNSSGPLLMILFLAFCIIMAIASVIEEANKARKQKQRDREWNDLSKP